MDNITRYATEEYYVNDYLQGRDPKFPLSEFNYWETQARISIDFYSLNRIKLDASLLNKFKIEIFNCACALAEFHYENEGTENKTSETVSGYSVNYKNGVVYKICQKHLWLTGLLYRGEK